MASPNLIPNLMSGNKGAADLSSLNMGVKPVGNAAGSNIPTGGVSGGSGAISTGPVSLNPAMNQPAIPVGVTGTTGNAFSTPGTSPLLPTNGAVVSPGSVSTVPTANGTPDLTSGVDTSKLSKQLIDEYGKGVGGLLTSELTNLGSADSSYMKAYESAMAMPNSEALSTLQTQLGNEGVSGNSSTAALATADLLSQQSAQEGLQEQQLLQSNIAEELGLTQGLQSTANKAQQDTGWSIFGSVLGDIGGAVASTFIPH